MHAVSVIVWESLVECGGKRSNAIWGVWVSEWCWCKFKWLSLDHHGHGNVVVVRWVLDFVSILLSNGLEGIVTNDLSECLQGDAVNDIKGVGWGHFQSKSSLLIDWDGDGLGVGIENLGIRLGGHGGEGVLEVNLGGGTGLGHSKSLGDELGGGLGGSSRVDLSSDSKGDYASHIYVK